MTVSVSQNPTQLVQDVLLGEGMVVSNITFNGVLAPAAPGPGTGVFATVPGSFPITSGIILSTGLATSIPGNEADGIMGDMLNNSSDPDLLAITTPGNTIQDRTILEFDFVPTGDSLKFNYIFASEEYPGFNCSPNYNDVFGFFLSGPGINGPFANNAINIALVPGTTLPVSIANIHGPDGGWDCDAANEQYYVSNTGGTTVVFGGYTTVLTALAQVICGETYHIKLAIGDAGDSSFDSAVFLEAGSFASSATVVAQLAPGNVNTNDSIMYEGCGPVDLSFIRFGDLSLPDTVELTVGGTATPGVDYFPPFPSQLIFAAGDSLFPWPLMVPLDADTDLETIVLTVLQNQECSGTQVETVFTLYIGQPPPLEVDLPDQSGPCGTVFNLDPQISGGAGMAYVEWSDGSLASSLQVSPGVTTTYTYTVYDTCSVVPYTDSVTVTLPVHPPVEVLVDEEVIMPCLSTAPVVAAGQGGNGVYTYAWTLDGAQVGSSASLLVTAGPPMYYVVTATDACGTQGVDSVLVRPEELPPIVVDGRDTTVNCVGDTVLLEVLGVVGGNGVYTYEWANADTTTLGYGNTLQVAVTESKTLILQVEDQCGNLGYGTFRALVPLREPFRQTLTPDTALCIGERITLSTTVRGGTGTYTIVWADQNHFDPELEVLGDVGRTYVVAVQDECGQVIMDSIRVDVEEPFARILPLNMGEDDWKLQSSIHPPNPRMIRWDMGDSTLSREPTVYHSYTDLLDHWVHLRVVSQLGCSASDSIQVRPPGSLFFPNSFTPDGDGVNEVFRPIGHGITEMEYRIYDRSGRLVYETDDPDAGWDGTIRGKKATSGVYVVQFRYVLRHTWRQEGHAHVTLLRGEHR